ncbi:MAG: acyltransferase family protein [Massilimicrobiota timonensis]
MNWNLVSKYRSHLMGFSILFIVLFHFCEMIGTHKELVEAWQLHLYQFGRYGYIGVEIFLFVSGIGCFFSYKKNPDILQFYKKRFIKILPTYCMVAIPFWIIFDVFILNKPNSFFIDFLGISFFNDVRVFWYVFLILGLYFIHPLLYNYLYNIKGSVFLKFLFLEVLLLGFIGWLSIAHTHFFDITEVALTRIPIYIFGVYCGHLVYNKESIPMLIVILFILTLFVLPLNAEKTYLMRVFNSLQSIGIIFICTFVFEYILPRFVNSILCFIGKYSFEIYLGHVAIRKIMNQCGIPTYQLNIYFIIVVLTIILTCCVSFISEKIQKRLV